MAHHHIRSGFHYYSSLLFFNEQSNPPAIHLSFRIFTAQSDADHFTTSIPPVLHVPSRVLSGSVLRRAPTANPGQIAPSSRTALHYTGPVDANVGSLVNSAGGAGGVVGGSQHEV
jgi:hypothetical protein